MKNVKIILLILAVCLSIIGSFAFAQVENDSEEKIVKTLPPPPEEDCPSEEACELWEEFKEKYGDAFSTVEWDFACGCVRHVYGWYDTGKGELKSEADAEALAGEFLSENAGFFGIDMAQLKFKRVDNWMVDYDQYYNGIPVYDGKVRVRMNDKGVLKAVKNNFYPGIDVSTEPKIGKVKAVGIAKRISNESFLASDMPRIISNTVLYIVPKTDNGTLNYHLTWAVPTYLATYFIDAEDRSVVHKVVAPAMSSPVSGGSIASVVPSLKYVVAVILLLTLILFWRWKRR